MNELKDLSGIIYLIRNKIDGKCYIGQTLYSFCHRYRNQWWKHATRYLKSAAAKHGHDNFEIKILEHSKTLEQLNILEEKYAKDYNCYSPHGYNLTGCGKNKTPHPESVLLRGRTIVLNDPNGNDVRVVNIRKFCRDNQLDGRAISRVISGKNASHKGWSLEGVVEKHWRNNHRYIFVDQENNKYEVIGLAKFCRERNLKYHSMRDMAQGKIKTSQGFALIRNAFSERRRPYNIALKNGERILEIENIKKECPKYGLHPRYIYQLIANKIPSYKGWRVVAIDGWVV